MINKKTNLTQIRVKNKRNADHSAYPTNCPMLLLLPNGSYLQRMGIFNAVHRFKSFLTSSNSKIPATLTEQFVNRYFTFKSDLFWEILEFRPSSEFWEPEKASFFR